MCAEWRGSSEVVHLWVPGARTPPVQRLAAAGWPTPQDTAVVIAGGE